MDSTIDPDQDDSGSSSNELYADLDSLKLDDGTLPKVGDSVDLQVSGKVTKIENNTACIQPDTINGEPVQPPVAQDNSDDDELEQLKQASQGVPVGSGY